jgi:hypothetical protein
LINYRFRTSPPGSFSTESTLSRRSLIYSLTPATAPGSASGERQQQYAADKNDQTQIDFQGFRSGRSNSGIMGNTGLSWAGRMGQKEDPCRGLPHWA